MRVISAEELSFLNEVDAARSPGDAEALAAASTPMLWPLSTRVSRASRDRGPRIYCEGDSWLAYPKNAIVFGSPSNIVDQLREIDVPGLVVYDQSSNGDEVVDMLCGESKFQFLKRVSRQEYDIVLFSGGGNDVVGGYDFPFLLRQYDG